jgi:hypothetical protein
MAQTQSEKVAKNTRWKRTAAGKKSQKKVIENIGIARKKGTYGNGDGKDISHPRTGKKGFTLESPAKNRGNKAEKLLIAKRNKRKGYAARFSA